MKKKKTDREMWLETLKVKDDIVDSIGKSSNYFKKIQKLRTRSISNPLSDGKVPVKRILTGTALDEILSFNGGIEVGSTVEFYGPFAAAKTQICETLVTEAEGLIIYIDSERTFRKERVKGIAVARGKDVEDINKRLLLYQPEDWMEQEAITMNLPEFDSEGNFIDVGLVIIDSLMKHWADAPEFFGREKLTTRQQMVRAELARLVRYVRRHSAVLVYTNQIYDKPIDTRYASPEQKIGARGGRSLEHIADYRILLIKKRGNVRVARLVDSPDIPLLEVPFVLDERGISDIPDPAERAKALELTESYREKFLSGRIGSKPAGKKYIEKAKEIGLIVEEDEEVEEVIGEE